MSEVMTILFGLLGCLGGLCACAMARTSATHAIGSDGHGRRFCFDRRLCADGLWALASGACSFWVAQGSYPLSSALFAVLFFMVLVYMARVDAAESIIPNRAILLAMALGCGKLFTDGLLGGAFPRMLTASLLGSFGILALISLVAWVMDRMTGESSLGGGDIKLFAVCGLWFGFEGGLWIIALACLISLVFRRRAMEPSGFPFAPYIAASTMIVAILSVSAI